MRTLFTLFSFLLALNLMGQKGYEIQGHIDGFTEKEIYLGYHYGDKQYIRDTTSVENGQFVFKGEETLEGGMYLLILPPNNEIIQILLNEGDQHFTVKSKVGSLNEDLVITGSVDNKLFKDYTEFLGKKMRPQAEALNEQLAAAKEAKDEAKIEQLQKELNVLNDKVRAHQLDVIKKNPKTFTAAVIKANLTLDEPTFEGENAEFDRWQYTRRHFFDNMDLGDPRFLRSPIPLGKVDYFLKKLTSPEPDSINKSLDYLLAKAEKSEEAFKFYLIHFLNSYAKSKIIGEDAVFVHLVDKYYATGKAPWSSEENLKKIVEKAGKLKPLLIGKIAPDITCQLFDLDASLKLKDHENVNQRFKTSGPKSLHGVDAEYTILFIWAPDCGHCKKAMPKMVEFYEAYKSKGIEIYSICSKFANGIPECTEYMGENRGMLEWINVVDPYHKSKYKTLYDVETTPQLYILNKDKKIILKRVGAEQLAETMDEVIRVEGLKKAAEEIKK